MKSIIKRSVSIWPSIHAMVIKGVEKMKRFKYVMILFLIAGLSGCFLHYYKTNTKTQTDAESLQSLIAGGKYFIVHANTKNYALYGVKLNHENIEGEIVPLAVEHSQYLHPTNEHKNKFQAKHKDFVLYEVHLYTQSAIQPNSNVSLPIKDFYQMDVYELNKEATNKSKVWSIVGITLATVGVVAIIAAAASVNDIGSTGGTPSSGGYSDMSCSPQVYSVSGDKSNLAGILYSGAIFAPIQRTDYLPLSGINPQDGQFHLQLKTGANEELYVHETKLLQVTHSKNHDVLLDHHGKIIVYQQPVAPQKVSIGGDEDLQQQVVAKDEKYYSFTNHPAGQNTSDILLEFKKPVGVTSGKLILSAKNSTWATYIFRQYKSLYGEYHAVLQQQKDKADPKKLLQCELDQSLPLSVFVKDGDHWKFVDFFYTPGNEVVRDMVMEIDLAEFKNTDHVQIKLATTYMFWDLDYAGMDFSQDLAYENVYVPARNVSKSNRVTHVIEQNPSGDITLSDKEDLNMDFAVNTATNNGSVNSYFLVGTGYYHDLTKYEGKRQLFELAAFSQKGAFDKFSRKKFDDLLSVIKNNGANNVASKN